MTTTRILPAVLLIALASAAPASGQFRMPTLNRTAAPAADTPAATLDRITAPVPPGGAAGESDPVATLTTKPGLPPGSYASPWYTDGPGCGPMGSNGPVAHEPYWRTGPSFAFGSGAYTDRLHMGWQVGIGAKSLFFNTTDDAAWTFDIGLSYTYNRGSSDDLLDVFLRQPDVQGANGQAVTQDDKFDTVRVRGLHRTSFNFGVGRDWFVWGSGAPGGEPGTNLRMGADLGGRWGTAHVDLVPFFEEGGYSRRQGVYHGFYLGFHSNCEVPMGGWIFFAGTRIEYGYDWMNLVPPINGDVQSVNLLFTGGVRF